MSKIHRLERRPLILLAVTLGSVWFYSYMLGPVLQGPAEFVTVIALSAITWFLVLKFYLRWE
ncbi:MAG: hypothetical protein ABEJ28_03185 [Salinigranum sp.]